MSWITGVVITKMAFGESLAGLALIVFSARIAPRTNLVARTLADCDGWRLGLADLGGGTSRKLERSDVRAQLAHVNCGHAALRASPFAAPLIAARRGTLIDGRLTGASSGGLVIVDYGLHYSDDTMPFLATWYSLAAATVTALLTIIMPRFLRW